MYKTPNFGGRPSGPMKERTRGAPRCRPSGFVSTFEGRGGFCEIMFLGRF